MSVNYFKSFSLILIIMISIGVLSCSSEVTQTNNNSLNANDENRVTSDSISRQIQIKAFPTAEGFGAFATGGRGGQVIKVTTLNSTGTGSLQSALNLQGPRIIVFDVSGVIEGDINIPYSDVTIAGQTAPGGGVTIHGRLECDYSLRPNNIIIRHIRIRADHSLNPQIIGDQYDAVQCSRSSNLIFDHISVSGGVDENFDLYEATNVTVQWSTITRADENGGHSEGSHNYGLINGPSGHSISIHHNLFAHNLNRNPAVANGPAEIINNVIYNVRHGFIHHNPATGRFNIIGNYYKQGPDNILIPFFFDDEYHGAGNPQLSYYLLNNYVDDPGDLIGNIDNPWLLPYEHTSFEYIDWGWDSSNARITQKHHFESVPVTIHNSISNYDLVLTNSGAFPHDLISIEDINEVQTRTGSWGNRMPNNLMSGLNAEQAPTDTDNDGMPDEWEINNGLSTVIADDSFIMPSGYTAVEEYINEVADSMLQ
ncbi:MAG: pectate lyase precursor [Gammaproteobacteria bacterium]|nr:pectate lyase precursor [Gammaproteobacteria bacterium]